MLPQHTAEPHSEVQSERSSGKGLRSNEEWLFLSSGLLTALTTIYLYLVKYRLISRLESNHNLRLLNSAKAWVDHGYWRLSGLLYFQEQYDGSLPSSLYRSHSPFYALPHYFAYRHGGESWFWIVVGLIPVFAAVVSSVALATFAWALVKSLPRTQSWTAVRGASTVVGVAAFSITFTSEPIWSLSWNSFDGSAASMVFVVAVAAALACSSPRLQSYRWAPSLLLVISAFLCARFGIALTASLLFIRLTELKSTSQHEAIRRAPIFSWPITIFVLLASLSHFLSCDARRQVAGTPVSWE